MSAFDPTRAARKIRSRHPDVKPSVAQVALYMASFANGNGTMIRPGVARAAEETGLHPDTVQDAIEWLVAHGELRRDKPGRRHSAACFTWIGGMEPHDSQQGSITPPKDSQQGSDAPPKDSQQGSDTPATYHIALRAQEDLLLVASTQDPQSPGPNAHTGKAQSDIEGSELVGNGASGQGDGGGGDERLAEGLAEGLAEPLAPSIWMDWSSDEPLPKYAYREPVLIDPKRYAPGVPVPGGRLYDPDAPLPHDPDRTTDRRTDRTARHPNELEEHHVA